MSFALVHILATIQCAGGDCRGARSEDPSNALIEAALNSKSVLVFGQRPEGSRNVPRRLCGGPEPDSLFDWC